MAKCRYFYRFRIVIRIRYLPILNEIVISIFSVFAHSKHFVLCAYYPVFRIHGPADLSAGFVVRLPKITDAISSPSGLERPPQGLFVPFCVFAYSPPVLAYVFHHFKELTFAVPRIVAACFRPGDGFRLFALSRLLCPRGFLCGTFVR